MNRLFYELDDPVQSHQLRTMFPFLAFLFGMIFFCFGFQLVSGIQTIMDTHECVSGLSYDVDPLVVSSSFWPDP